LPFDTHQPRRSEKAGVLHRRRDGPRSRARLRSLRSNSRSGLPKVSETASFTGRSTIRCERRRRSHGRGANGKHTLFTRRQRLQDFR
jgi:hypothetical protein